MASKKQWTAPRVEAIALAADTLAALFPQLSAEQRDEIARKAAEQSPPAPQ